MPSLKETLQANFNTSAISVQVLPFSTFNEKGEHVDARQLVVLDAEDRFMFVIGYAAADEYMVDGYVNYEKIYKDYILTEAQWDIHTKESQEETVVAEETKEPVIH